MEDIFKELSIKYDKDKRVIKLICEHPLFFTRRRIEDPNDIRAIMITYFGKFVPKFGKTVEDKVLNVNKYLSKKPIAKDSNKINITT
jgi:hypothetical protein